MAFSLPLTIFGAQIFAAAVLMIGHVLLLARVRRWRISMGMAAFTLLFMAVLLASSIASGYFGEAIPQLRKSWVLFCIFPLAVLGWAYSSKLAIEAFLAGAVVASLVGIGRVISGGIERAAPFSGGYTTLALFEAAALPFAFTLAIEPGRRRWTCTAAIPILIAGLIMTQTRAGWAAAIVAISLIGFYKSRKATAIAIAAVVILAAVIPQARGIIRERFDPNREGGFTSGRLLLWNQARGALAGLPLFGYGPGSFKRLAPPSLLEEIGDPGVASWHCTPLDILIESGPPALVAILVAMTLPLIFAWRAFRRRGKSLEGLALFAALLALYLAGLTTNLMRDFLLLGLLALLWAVSMREDETFAEDYWPVKS